MDDRLRPRTLLALLAIYIFLSAILPGIDDEFYYWCWAKELQWSYYDHPPMTAFLIWLSTTLFGDSVVAFRLPACVATVIVVAIIDRLTPLKWIVWAVILTPLFTIGAVMITPDSPLVLFWSLYVWWMIELDQRLAQQTSWKSNLGWWTLGGILLGCGVLSKYTMGLAVPTGFLCLVLARRRWSLWLPGYIYHGVISFLVASPILIYNIQQHFEPLLYQWQHAAERAPNRLLSIGDFLGVQILLFGTMPIVLFPWVIRNFRSLTTTSRLRVSTVFYALPLAFFLYKSTQTRLQGNWALICFISFWPIACEWYQTIRESALWRRLTAASFLPPLISVVVVAIHLIHPIPLVPIPGDRVYRQIAMNETTAEIAKAIREQNLALPVYTDSYQLTSLLRFQKLPANQIDGLTRPSHFTRPPRHLTDVDQAYVVTEHPVAEEFCKGFEPPELVGEFPVIYRQKTDRTLRVWKYAKSRRS